MTTPEPNLALLKRQRASIKASCTRTRTYVENVIEVTPFVIAQLEERKIRLDEHWSEYCVVQSQIESLDENECNDRAGFEEAFHSLAARTREILSSASPRVTASSPSSSRASSQSESHLGVRLPKLNLPTFSGKYDEWFPFHDSFNSIIHANTSLNNVQKLQYLRSSLTGDASKIVSSLEISDLNYDVAWNLLRERYDNRRVIIQTHVKAIMDLPSMVKENATSLRQIADGATRHIHALQALKRPTAHWDDLLVHILSAKLDTLTLREWQQSLVGVNPPTFRQFNEFMINYCQMLEATGKTSDPSKDNSKRAQANAKRQTSCVTTVKAKCSYCNGEHAMYYCKDFLALSVAQRMTEVQNRKVCVNCLRSPPHALNKCASRGCKICKAKHNTLLHANGTITEASSGKSESASSSATAQPVVVTHASSSDGWEYTMLSTAIVNVFDRNGTPQSCRVLLDCGSQANLISQKCINDLGLQPHSTNITISGVGQAATRATQAVKIKMQSRLNSFSAMISCIVTEHITDKLPACTMRKETYIFPRNIHLADPTFNVSSTIDILIGAEMFWELLCVGQIKSSLNHPTLQKTQLGWILAGRRNQESRTSGVVQSFHLTVTNEQLQQQLSRFWQLEDVGDTATYNQEEAYCEQHFLDNVSQTTQGRYVVKLPFKEPLPDNLGNSKDIALKRLRNMERRFNQNPVLKTQYVNFMSEYMLLGHMKLVDGATAEDSSSFYLPHHCVFKNSKQSSKIRVVFDVSSKPNTGTSLNNLLRVGPVVQHDLMSIVMRFRTFAYVLVADIIKMYRQVLVYPSQTQFQRILWRSDSTSTIETYELTTVTYGTSSASFLVTRCLKHLAETYASNFPVGSMHVKNNFYMDDLLTGADTIHEAKTARDEIIQLLKLGHFELSKWASNYPPLLESIKGQSTEPVVIDDADSTHILGVQWNQGSDTLHFSYKPDDDRATVSKRIILSDISKLFDPLGLLGPTIVIAKLILQDLWRSDIRWDESVPQKMHTRWLTFKSQLTELNQVTIPRRVKFSVNRDHVQIHGFCDASQQAYGACVYVRTRLRPNDYRSELLCSKSRVAPLKAISLPRLELSAALLLARLIEKVRTSIDLTGVRMYLWSDSTITLNWISSSSRRWSVFVANRIGEIQRLTEPKDWRHVPSAENPADMLSRGLNPSDLINATAWWKGPTFLQLHDDHWPDNDLPPLVDDALEMKKLCNTVNVSEHNSSVNELLSRRSNLGKVCRILAYYLRAFKRSNPRTTFVPHEEESTALNLMIKWIQQVSFPGEYKALNEGKTISTTSKILSLNPFMDDHGLIRVGGRLKNSSLPFDARHPILLPRDHELTKRIIAHEHIRSLHAGAQATMATVRQRFWPLSLRSSTRKIISKCIRCFKTKPTHSEALMASLPSGRVTPSRPFLHCGVDYAGPLILREGKRRNARNHKAYVAVFVCFAVKAVHIELVSDLTADAFIAALKRFVSRRGKPSQIYSDNGTTFVGARNQLKELFKFLSENQVLDDIREFLRQQHTSWHFIPPNAPHCGGLWEAAVKSVKHHMNRIVGKAHLTFEEMQTTLCEIESILNSRPLIALSTDPNDFSYLSPGHFLIGTTMNDFPSHNLCDANEGRLVRWQRVEQLRQHFWRRWSLEYLHFLQARSKWRTNKGDQLRPGQLVLVKQQDLPPLQWLLGRVLEVHVGSDNVVRTATIKTAKSLLTRPLSRLAILPTEASDTGQ